MKVEAKLNNLRISPRKVRLVADAMRGLDVDVAYIQLKNTVKGAVSPFEKLLRSAVANAENNFGLDRDNLYISDVTVGCGATLKRWLPRAHGRATQLMKRTSKIVLTVAERVEGKNRKSKEQLAKERKEREELKKKLEEQMAREHKEDVAKDDQVVEKVTGKPGSRKRNEEQGKGGRKGWLKKMFQRKSA